MNVKKVPGERIVAAIIDSVILGIISFIVTMIYMIATGAFNGLFEVWTTGTTTTGLDTGFTEVQTLILTAIELGFGLLYFVYIPWKWNGATIGKKIMSIKAIDEFGNNPTFFKHFLRAIQNWSTYVSAALVFLIFIDVFVYSLIVGFLGVIVSIVTFIAFIMLLAREDGKGLHDMMAGTYVVKANFDPNQEYYEKTSLMGDWAEVKATDDDGFMDEESPKDEGFMEEETQDTSDDEDPWKY